MLHGLTRIETQSYNNLCWQHLIDGCNKMAAALRQLGYVVRTEAAHSDRIDIIIRSTRTAPTGEVYNVGWGDNGIIGYVFKGTVRFN